MVMKGSLARLIWDLGYWTPTPTAEAIINFYWALNFIGLPSIYQSLAIDDKISFKMAEQSVGDLEKMKELIFKAISICCFEGNEPLMLQQCGGNIVKCEELF